MSLTAALSIIIGLLVGVCFALGRHCLRLLRINARLYIQTQHAAHTITHVVAAAQGVTDCLETLYDKTSTQLRYSNQTRHAIAEVIRQTRQLGAHVIEPEASRAEPGATRWPYNKEGKVTE